MLSLTQAIGLTIAAVAVTAAIVFLYLEYQRTKNHNES